MQKMIMKLKITMKINNRKKVTKTSKHEKEMNYKTRH